MQRSLAGLMGVGQPRTGRVPRASQVGPLPHTSTLGWRTLFTVKQAPDGGIGVTAKRLPRSPAADRMENDVNPVLCRRSVVRSMHADRDCSDTDAHQDRPGTSTISEWQPPLARGLRS